MDDNAGCTREPLAELAARIAELSLRIDTAKHALLGHVRTFDTKNGWADAGFVSMPAWLAWWTNMGASAAREHVRVARALAELPRIDAAFAAGELSYSKVRALSRVATAKTEQEFINIARHATASQIEQLTRAYRRVQVDPKEPGLDMRRYVRRSQTPSGMVRIHLQLPPEQANIVWEALSAALDAGQHADGSPSVRASAETSAVVDAATSASAETPAVVAKAARASAETSAVVVEAVGASAETSAVVGEAVGASAETSAVVGEAVGASAEAPGLAHASAESPDMADQPERASAEAPGLTHEPKSHDTAQVPESVRDPAGWEAALADAIVSVSQAYLQHRPRTLGSGYELVMLTSKDQLEHGPGGVGGFLRDGTPVPLHMARMLACDGTRVDVTTGESGELLDVGRARRTIPSAIGRALWLRDAGCRVPGCGRRHHLHAHHMHEWAKGGPTALDNLVLLCPRHHALVHEGRLSITVREGKLVFATEHGLTLPAVPERHVDRVELERWLARFDPDFEPDGTPRWDGSRFELREALDGMLSYR